MPWSLQGQQDGGGTSQIRAPRSGVGTPLSTQRPKSSPKVWSASEAQVLPSEQQRSEPAGTTGSSEPFLDPSAHLWAKPNNGHTANFNPVRMVDGNHRQWHKVHVGDGFSRQKGETSVPCSQPWEPLFQNSIANVSSTRRAERRNQASMEKPSSFPKMYSMWCL